MQFKIIGLCQNVLPNFKVSLERASSIWRSLFYLLRLNWPHSCKIPILFFQKHFLLRFNLRDSFRAYTLEILSNNCSFNKRSFRKAESIGDAFCAICWISSLVSALLRLKNILVTLSNCIPVRSRASTVFSKVGAAV